MAWPPNPHIGKNYYPFIVPDLKRKFFEVLYQFEEILFTFQFTETLAGKNIRFYQQVFLHL